QLSNDDERMGAPELRLEWRAQRPSGDDLPVAGTAPAVDHQHRKILEKRGIVEAVVHDDDARVTRDAGAFDAIARHDGRRGARQRQRLVTHLARAMPRRINQERTGKRAAIAAGEKY